MRTHPNCDARHAGQPRRSGQARAHGARAALLIVLIVVYACNDESASRSVAPPDQVTGSQALDPAINPSDSWASADVTLSGSLDVTSDEPFLDPATDETVNSTTDAFAAGQVSFQTGFSTSGESVAVTYHTPDPEDPDTTAIALTKVIGGVATDYDAQGRVVPETATDTLEGPSPINELPAINAQPMIDALVKPAEDGGGGGGDDCTDCEIGIRAAPAASASVRVGSAPGYRVIARTASLLVIESRLDGSSAPGLAQVAGIGSSEPHGKHMRRGYSRRGEHWVLDSLTFEDDGPAVERAGHGAHSFGSAMCGSTSRHGVTRFGGTS